MSSVRALLSLVVVLSAAACGGGSAPANESVGAAAPAGGVVIRLTGSDTMLNLNQTWAENYRTVKPEVSVQIAAISFLWIHSQVSNASPGAWPPA